MQQRPNKTALLDALAQFLLTEIQPAIADKRLGFRVLIAANLANIVSSELQSEETRSADELRRLQDLLSKDPEASALLQMPARLAALETLNRELSVRLREDSIPADQLPAVHEHLRRTLSEALAVTNPRFDTSPTIE